MNTPFKAAKCRKRDSLKPFFWKNRSKNNFFETFFLLRKKDFTLPFYLCIVKTRKYGGAA